MCDRHETAVTIQAPIRKEVKITRTKKGLKLITQYDAGRNEYAVYRHNLTPEGVNDVVRELSARLFGLFVVDQHAKHSAADPDDCKACRRK